MKSRQLANVLIKVLGFSTCLYAVPECISGIVFQFTRSSGPISDELLSRIIFPVVGGGVQVLFGIIIIAASPRIAGWMFKEDE